MLESPRVRRQVWYWERRFQALNGAIPERRPPAVVWRKVRGRIDRPGSGARNLWWPVGGLLAASLVIAVMLFWPAAPAPPAAERGLPWLGRAAARRLRLRFAALGAPWRGYRKRPK